MTIAELIGNLEQFDDSCTVRFCNSALKIYDFTRPIKVAFVGEIEPEWYDDDLDDLD